MKLEPSLELLYESLSKKCQEAVVLHGIAIEGLTMEQTAEAMKQAILAGDFVRYVHRDHQAVIYLPFRERNHLKAQLDAADEKINKILEVLDAYAG